MTLSARGVPAHAIPGQEFHLPLQSFSPAVSGENTRTSEQRYSGYNKVSAAKRLACWAHIRRYLIDAIPKGKQLDYTQPSVQGVMYINRLFEKEDKIRQKHKTFDAIKEARLTHEKPIIEGFLSWLEKQTPVRSSRLDKAVTYIRNRKEHLMTYLEDGRCSFSNNLSENSIRPFVVGRKGWLFCDTPAIDNSHIF